MFAIQLLTILAVFATAVHATSVPNCSIAFQIRGTLASTINSSSIVNSVEKTAVYYLDANNKANLVNSYTLSTFSYQNVSFSAPCSTAMKFYLDVSNVGSLKVGSNTITRAVVVNDNNMLFEKQPLASLAAFRSSGPSISAAATGPFQLTNNGSYYFTIPATNTNFATVVSKNMTVSPADCDLKSKTLVCLRLRGNIGSSNDQERVQISIIRNNGQRDIYFNFFPLTTTFTLFAFDYTLDPSTNTSNRVDIKSISITYLNDYKWLLPAVDRNVYLDLSSFKISGAPYQKSVITISPPQGYDSKSYTLASGELGSPGEYSFKWNSDPLKTITTNFLLKGLAGTQYNALLDTNYAENVEIYYKFSNDNTWAFNGNYQLGPDAYTKIAITYPNIAQNLTIKIVTHNAFDLPNLNISRGIFLNDNGFTIGSATISSFSKYLSCDCSTEDVTNDATNGLFTEDTNYFLTLPYKSADLEVTQTPKITSNFDCSSSTTSVCVNILVDYKDDNEKVKVDVGVLYDDDTVEFFYKSYCPSKGTNTIKIDYSKNSRTGNNQNKSFKSIVVNPVNVNDWFESTKSRRCEMDFNAVYVNGKKTSKDSQSVSCPNDDDDDVKQGRSGRFRRRGMYRIGIAASTDNMVSFQLRGVVGSTLNSGKDKKFNEIAAVYAIFGTSNKWEYITTVTLEADKYTTVNVSSFTKGLPSKIKISASNTSPLNNDLNDRTVVLNDNNFYFGGVLVPSFADMISCADCPDDEMDLVQIGTLTWDADYILKLPATPSSVVRPFAPSWRSQVDCNQVVSSSAICFALRGQNGLGDEQEKVNISILHADNSREVYYRFYSLSQNAETFSIDPNRDSVSGNITNKGFSKLIITFLNDRTWANPVSDRNVYLVWSTLKINGNSVQPYQRAISGPYPVPDVSAPLIQAGMYWLGDYTITYTKAPSPMNVSFLMRNMIATSSSALNSSSDSLTVNVYYQLSNETDWTFVGPFTLLATEYKQISFNYPYIGKPLNIKITPMNLVGQQGSSLNDFSQAVFLNDNGFSVNGTAVYDIASLISCPTCSSGASAASQMSRGILTESKDYIVTIPYPISNIEQPFVRKIDYEITCTETYETSICLDLRGENGVGNEQEKVTISVVHADGTEEVYYRYAVLPNTLSRTFKIDYSRNAVTGVLEKRGFSKVKISFLNEISWKSPSADRNVYIDYSEFIVNGEHVAENERTVVYPVDAKPVTQNYIDGFFGWYGVYTITYNMQNPTKVTFLLRGVVGADATKTNSSEISNEIATVSYKLSGDSGWTFVGKYSLVATNYTTVTFTYPNIGLNAEIKITPSNTGPVSGSNVDRMVVLNDNGFVINNTVVPHFAPYIGCAACDTSAATSASRGFLRLNTDYILTLPSNVNDIKGSSVLWSDSNIDCGHLDETSICFKMYGSSSGLEQAKVNISVLYTDGTEVLHYKYHSLTTTAALFKLNYTSVDSNFTRRIFKKLNIFFVNEMSWANPAVDRNVFFDYNTFTVNGMNVQQSERPMSSPSDSGNSNDAFINGNFNWYGLYSISYVPDPCKTTTFVSAGDRLCMYIKSSQSGMNAQVNVSYIESVGNQTMHTLYTVGSTYSSIPISLDSALIQSIKIIPVSSQKPVVLNTNGFLLNGDMIDSNNYCISDDLTINDVFDLAVKS